jgi:hypothetical protein
MSDHADDRTWTIARLLFATHLPFLLLAYGVFVTAVLVITFGIDLWGTVSRSVWDPAVSIVRWFALGYGLYFINRLLPVCMWPMGGPAASSSAPSPCSWWSPGPWWPRC